MVRFRVVHKCCQLERKSGDSAAIHDGNDCFVYELPDGITKGNYSNDPDVNEKEIKLLNDANSLPDDFKTYDGYRLRLFMLKNKSKSKLLVKGIERQRCAFFFNKLTLPKHCCTKKASHAFCIAEVKFVF